MVGYISPLPTGAVVQLGERLTGSQEVRGSTPLGSIKIEAVGVNVDGFLNRFWNWNEAEMSGR
jgi:hypothetical protein